MKKNNLSSKNTDRFYIQHGILYEVYFTARGQRYRAFMSLPFWSDNYRLSDEDISLVEFYIDLISGISSLKYP